MIEKYIKNIFYIIFSFMLVCMGLFAFSARFLESNDQLKMAIEFYRFGKLFVHLVLIVWCIQLVVYIGMKIILKVRKKKSYEHIFSQIFRLIVGLFMVPMFFSYINDPIPDKFEKLIVVDALLDGKTTSDIGVNPSKVIVKDLRDYPGEKFIYFVYSAAANGRPEGEYYSRGYLYVRKPYTHFKLGLHHIFSMEYIGNNWYEVDSVLDP